MPYSVFPSAIAGYIFFIVCGCWVLLEARLFIKKRQNNAVSRDKNSAVLMTSIYVITAWGSLWVVYSGVGFWAYSDTLFFIGICLMLSGMFLRHYSINTLGKYFTVQVQIQRDHQLVESGPYKYIRHPSYTGTYIALLGIGIALHNWIAFLLLATLPLISTAYRISVEEKALTQCLGKAYEEYMKRTGRLIPRLTFVKQHMEDDK